MKKILLAAFSLIVSLNVGAAAYRNRPTVWHYGDGAAYTSSTANTSENTVMTFTVPGGVIGPNGHVVIHTEGTSVGGAGTTVLKVKYGACVVVSINVTSATENYNHTRYFYNNNSQSAQSLLNFAQNNADNLTSSAETTCTVDSSADQTVTVTTTKGTASDALIQHSIQFTAFYAP